MSVVNAATNAFITDIVDPSIDAPQGAVVTPDGSKLYVTNAFGGAIVVIDTATNAVLTTIPGFDSGRGVDVHPSGSLVYVARDFAGVNVIDTTTDTIVTSIPFSFPTAVRVHPDGTRLYIAGYGSLAMVDTTTYAVLESVPTPSNHFGLDINPAGTKVYVTTLGPDQVEVYDATTLAPITTIPNASVPPDDTKWAAAGTKGYKYKDDAGAADGIDKMLLKSSDQNTAKVLVKGKGPNLPDPPALDTLAPPILVQLINDETSAC